MKSTLLSTLLCGLASSAPAFSSGWAQTQIEYFPTSTADLPRVETEVLRGGKEEGTEIIRIYTTDQVILVSPSRGMNIISWTYNDGTDAWPSAGWTNPVDEIVNPIFINQMHREGSGFLDGFNEVVARCGFEFVGHAGWDGDEYLTLHGLNAATPARDVDITVGTDTITITASMHQKAFKKVDFLVTTVMTIPTTGTTFTIQDSLTNNNPYDREYMVLYHSNFGGVQLAGGSQIYVPAADVWPFNKETIEIAAEFDEPWNEAVAPSEDYDETVYNIYPKADGAGNTQALLVHPQNTSAVQVKWNVNQMEVFGLWKNLDKREQGYVVGLEPGTSFSYNRRFNRDLELVPTIVAGESKTFRVDFAVLTTTQAVTAAIQEVATIQGDDGPTVHNEPLHDEIIPSEGNNSGVSSVHHLATLTLMAVAIATFGGAH